MSPLSCPAFRSGLQAAAAGETGDPRAGRAEAHAVHCAACRADLAAARRLLMVVEREADADAEPPAGFVGRVLANLPRRSPHPRGAGRLAWVLPIAALAPLLLLPLPGLEAPEQFAAARAALDAISAGAARLLAVVRALEWAPTWRGGAGGGSAGVAQLVGLVLMAGGLLAAAAAVLLAANPGARRRPR